MKLIFNYFKELVSSLWFLIFGAKGGLKELKFKTTIVLSNNLPIDVCQRLVLRINELIDAQVGGRVWQDAVGSDSRVLGFERDIGDCLDLFDVPGKIRAIDSYTAKKTRSWLLMANRVLPKECNLGSGGGFHRDSPFSHQVKYIWYLCDVGPKNGPFQYISGTNRGLIFNKKYPLGVSRFPEIFDKPIEVNASAGSLIICDTKCIHGGKPISSGARYAITLYTFSKKNGAINMFEKSGLNFYEK